MKSADYWQKRAEQVGDLQHIKAGQFTKSLYKEYERAKRAIQRDIEVFYGRYASNNGVSLAEAKKQLDAGELKEFKMTLEEFIDKAKNNKDGKWTKQLNNVYYRTRVSRLEALELQIMNQVRLLAHGQEQGLAGLLGDVYEDTYYRSIFEIQKGVGIGVTFAKLDTEAIERVVKTPWLGGNYSTRVWGNTEKLASQLSTTLSQAIASGRSTAQTSALLAKRMDVSFSAAEALINTETAYIVTEATFDGYRGSGVVKKYQFVATLSERTCKACGGMDGRTFKLSEKMIGINAALLHPRCRCTTVAAFDDYEDPGRRIAKDPDVYYVDGDMTYKQWYAKYIEPLPDTKKSKQK
ncbi:minor capsid protein [Paenibacillus thiaminolyticus]|uniref:minor capsid protein n=1 Tax=Paenibacillus thiaminolyticus TaxID=49283 RepID=UPI0013F5D340|nr:minor capsid protein [Paenibacillus thiaminolyticus]NGP59993.1 minor capsid protein [Paenibacillus thiaminolyticus]